MFHIRSRRALLALGASVAALAGPATAQIASTTAAASATRRARRETKQASTVIGHQCRVSAEASCHPVLVNDHGAS